MSRLFTIFLCGDVMTGRGIDQILPHPSDPILYESYVKNANDYVRLAEKANGPIGRSVNYAYIWGYALGAIKEADIRIINLETSITQSNEYLDKGINYRMHPNNIQCLSVADIDCCALANNHVLDWGQKGLLETLETLRKSKLDYAGAGVDAVEANAPCILPLPNQGRVLVFSFGLTSSGIPRSWKAAADRPGVHVRDDLSLKTVGFLKTKIARYKQPGDVVVASVHWGPNWGYGIPEAHKSFAHHLIDHAGVDIIHGHSSHHVLGIEVYKDKPIIYGCGDFLNDYEGIRGHKAYRGDLGLMYFVQWNPVKVQLESLLLVPTHIRKFQIQRPNKKDRQWMMALLNREGRQFGTKVEWVNEHTLSVVSK